MPASTTFLDAFTITYEPATHRLLARWAAAVADERLRTQYADLLTAAGAYRNYRFWLLDLRAHNWHTPAFGQWFSQVFAAAAHAALRQPVFIAYVLSAEHKALADTLGAQATQRGCATHNLYPFFFDSEAPALAWLTHQQAYDGPG